MSDAALYEIEHISRYLYSSPVRQCVLSLCLRPRDDAQQRLLGFDLGTDPPAPLNSETDFFGNTKQVLNIHREHEALEITARSTVERGRAAPLPDSLGAGAWEEIHSWRELSGYWDFTHPGASARPSPPLTAFVDEAGIEPSGDPLESLLRLSDILHHSFQYVPGSTSVVSPIEHILESRQGVCQDYAHVMIAIARSWGIPARYVSGYLYVDGQGDEVAPQTATHAWVECCLPGQGWIGFDPTNRCLAEERHVRVGIGRDYRDVTPVRGVFVGGGTTRLEVDVRVLAGRR
jgi:transglutaminase-like putative cysteine protease